LDFEFWSLSLVECSWYSAEGAGCRDRERKRKRKRERERERERERQRDRERGREREGEMSNLSGTKKADLSTQSLVEVHRSGFCPSHPVEAPFDGGGTIWTNIGWSEGFAIVTCSGERDPT
jgi:hypothetical protein